MKNVLRKLLLLGLKFVVGGVVISWFFHALFLAFNKNAAVDYRTGLALSSVIVLVNLLSEKKLRHVRHTLFKQCY